MPQLPIALCDVFLLGNYAVCSQNLLGKRVTYFHTSHTAVTGVKEVMITEADRNEN